MQLLLKTKFIIVVLVLLSSLLQGCTKDFDLNPTSTIVRMIVQNNE
jgi:hypothetical protein